MINFDAVDISERHPEEVMFLLMLSVCHVEYILAYMYIILILGKKMIPITGKVKIRINK